MKALSVLFVENCLLVCAMRVGICAPCTLIPQSNVPPAAKCLKMSEPSKPTVKVIVNSRKWARIITTYKYWPLQTEDGFICKLCGKTFTKSQNARRHLRNAHVSQPMTCSFCNKTLKNERTYKMHVSLNHTDKQWFTYLSMNQ